MFAVLSLIFKCVSFAVVDKYVWCFVIAVFASCFVDDKYVCCFYIDKIGCWFVVDKSVLFPITKATCFVLFDLILYVPSTIFQLNRDRSSWFEPVLS